MARMQIGGRHQAGSWWGFPIRQETKIETTAASAGRVQEYMTFLRGNRRAQGIDIIVYAKCGVGMS